MKISRKLTANTNLRYLIRADHDRQVSLEFIHDKPGVKANISILVIASHKAKVDLEATAIITSKADNCQTWLSVKVITMDQATVCASPNLKISNNQVQAGHALSTIHIGNDELYYLASRGINEQAARQLIINSLIKNFTESANGGIDKCYKL